MAALIGGHSRTPTFACDSEGFLRQTSQGGGHRFERRAHKHFRFTPTNRLREGFWLFLNRLLPPLSAHPRGDGACRTGLEQAKEADHLL